MANDKPPIGRIRLLHQAEREGGSCVYCGCVVDNSECESRVSAVFSEVENYREFMRQHREAEQQFRSWQMNRIGEWCEAAGATVEVAAPSPTPATEEKRDDEQS